MGGKITIRSDHLDGVNDWNCIKKSLNKYFPNRLNIAVFDVNATKKKGETERQKIEFKNKKRNQKPAEARGDAGKKAKQDNDDKVDAEVDERGGSSRKNDNPFWKSNFTHEVGADEERLDALICAFYKKVPEDSSD